jgi:hypothetical protein
MSDIKFAFKTNKDTGVKRETLTLNIPLYDLDGLIEEFNSENAAVHALILGAVNDVVIQAARDQVNGNETITQETLDVQALTLAGIAAIPAAVRKSNAITKESWTAFLDCYKWNAPALFNVSEVQVARALAVYAAKLKPLEFSADKLKKLQSYLMIFADQPYAADHAQVLEYLLGKAEEYLNLSTEEAFG